MTQVRESHFSDILSEVKKEIEKLQDLHQMTISYSE